MQVDYSELFRTREKIHGDIDAYFRSYTMDVRIDNCSLNYNFIVIRSGFLGEYGLDFVHKRHGCWIICRDHDLSRKSNQVVWRPLGIMNDITDPRAFFMRILAVICCDVKGVLEQISKHSFPRVEISLERKPQVGTRVSPTVVQIYGVPPDCIDITNPTDRLHFSKRDTDMNTVIVSISNSFHRAYEQFIQESS